VKCINPNPYSIKIVGSTPGRVFVGSHRELPVGKLEVLPGSVMREQGNGTVRVKMSADVSLVDAHSLLPHFLTDNAIPVLMELRFDVGVYISFGLRSWGASVPFSKACGLNVAGVLASSSGASNGLGPLVCRPSFDELTLPPIDYKFGEKLTSGNMGFTAAQVAPEEVANGEVAKNVSLLTVIVFTLVCGSILIYCALFDGFRRFSLWLAARREDAFAFRQQARAAASRTMPAWLQKTVQQDVVKGPEELASLMEHGEAVGGESTNTGETAASSSAPLMGDLLSPRRRTLQLAASSPSCSPSVVEESPVKVKETLATPASKRNNTPSPGSLQPRPVLIRGATGPCAPAVNGLYVATNELVGGRVAFKREGDEDDEMWLCFDAEVGANWKVQRPCDRGSATGYMHSDGDTADAEQPGLAVRWKVWDGEQFELQDSVSLLLLPNDSATPLKSASPGEAKTAESPRDN